MILFYIYPTVAITLIIIAVYCCGRWKNSDPLVAMIPLAVIWPISIILILLVLTFRSLYELGEKHSDG